MNVALVGSGGREHAIAWRLSKSASVKKVYVLPGNPGTEAIAENVAIAADDLPKIEKFVRENAIDLVVIGPEDPLAAGLADRLASTYAKVFGPVAAAARLEADKWFAKELMRHQAVPTAEARSFTSLKAAEEYITHRDSPCVVKATGLAKGKGVSVCYRTADAIDAARRMLSEKTFGKAGERIVVEELLQGVECSVLALVDGKTIYTMPPAQDHKAIDDGDTGPMTGGMGAYSPTPVIDDAMLATIERDVLVPTIDGLKRDGIEFRGVLYAGLMLTAGGPKVLEFNVRFGDPETQPLMMRFKGDLAATLHATATGTLDQVSLDWDPRPAMCVVAASGGYPGSYQRGLPISGLEDVAEMKDVEVFHAGTKVQGETIVTDGGRVLGITAIGETLKDARDLAYAAADKIRFDGMHFRRDIGHQALRGR